MVFLLLALLARGVQATDIQAGSLGSENCDASLFWNGFEYHINESVTCVSGDVFEATGQGTDCAVVGRCQVYLDEGARVSFLDGSALRLGKGLTQTSADSSLVFDGDVAVSGAVNDFQVAGKVRISNSTKAEGPFTPFGFHYKVGQSGTFILENSIVANPPCPCIYPEGGEIVVRGSAFYDTRWLLYLTMGARGNISLLDSYIGPYSNDFIEVRNQNVLIRNVTVYNTDENYGADIFTFYDSNARLENVTFAGARYYSSGDVVSVDSTVIARGIKNRNFDYATGDPTFCEDGRCHNRFIVMGSFIQYNPDNYIMAEVEGEKTCRPGATGTFKFFLDADDPLSSPTTPSIEVLSPCRPPSGGVALRGLNTFSVPSRPAMGEWYSVLIDVQNVGDDGREVPLELLETILGAVPDGDMREVSPASLVVSHYLGPLEVAQYEYRVRHSWNWLGPNVDCDPLKRLSDQFKGFLISNVLRAVFDERVSGVADATMTIKGIVSALEEAKLALPAVKYQYGFMAPDGTILGGPSVLVEVPWNKQFALGISVYLLVVPALFSFFGENALAYLDSHADIEPTLKSALLGSLQFFLLEAAYAVWSSNFCALAKDPDSDYAKPVVPEYPSLPFADSLDGYFLAMAESGRLLVGDLTAASVAYDRFLAAESAGDTKWQVTHLQETADYLDLFAQDLLATQSFASNLTIFADSLGLSATIESVGAVQDRIFHEGLATTEADALIALGVGPEGVSAVASNLLSFPADLFILSDQLGARILDASEGYTLRSALIDSLESMDVRPTADAGGPYFAVEGAAVQLNGTASRDPDGGLVRYEWDLDYDGRRFTADISGPVPKVTFETPGRHLVALRVFDDLGAHSEVATSFVDVATRAEVWLAPGTLNPRSQGRVATLYIELGPAFSSADIVRSTIKVTVGDITLLPLAGPWDLTDNDNDGIVELMVKLDRSLLLSAFETTLTFSVRGTLTEGVSFFGEASVRIL